MDMVEKYYHLLLALESDPLISMKDLATKLNITFPTLKKRYQFLLDEKIILNSSCSINLEALGLTKILVYFEVENYSQLTTLEKIGELHPYTRYHGRCIGNKFGLYFEFDIPDEDQCFELILELFNTIIERRIASSVKVYSSLGYRHEIFPDFTKFDPDNRKWDFDWESWFNKLPQQDNIINYELSKKIDPINLTKIRLDILRMFTINASFKQADLIRDSTLHLSRTEAHRHYNFVKKNLVKSVKFNYNRKSFDLDETYLFFLDDISDEIRGKLINHFILNPPPFRISIDLLEDSNIFIWGNMNSSYLRSFSFHLWKLVPQLRIYQLDSQSSESILYYFWPDNFDFDRNTWKVSKDYLIHEPLTTLTPVN